MENEKLNSEDVCRIFKISKGTLKKMRDEGLPFFRIGNCIRYEITEVENWIRNKNDEQK